MNHAQGRQRGPDGYAWSERQKELIEQFMYGETAHDHGVQRINTAYFSILTPDEPTVSAEVEDGGNV
jgi:hypothetical protein